MSVPLASDSVRLLSAHYAIDTCINHRPRHRTRAAEPGATVTAIETAERLPRLSPAVLAFLSARDEDVVALAHKPVVNVPIVRDDLSLKHYFISASHNTYLLGWQLFGRASAAAYTHVLRAPTPARCVEIDVWWDARKEGGMLVVTHGWTFSKSVPFADVCVAIGEALDAQDWPVFISLECHVPPAHQDELVRIMVDSWGERLVQGEIEGVRGEALTPRQLRGRILLMVEYYPDGMDIELDEDVVLETDQEGPDRGPQMQDEVGGAREQDNTVDASHPPKIGDELGRLGFYARSMKPPNEWWDQVFPSPPNPPHIVLNVNERRLPTSSDLLPALVQHATHYLRRIYPHGTRLTSSNLDPWVQWQSGTHIACLNWQRWDEPMWFNEAMFIGTGGWAVRPDSELANFESGKTRFVARVVGVSALPRPKGDQHDFVGYCHAELVHRDGKQVWQSDHVHGHSELELDARGPLTAAANDVVHLTWDQSFEWTFDADALTFFLLKVVRRHAVRQDEDVAVFCVRMDQLAAGWCLLRLMDMQGKYVGATLLCEFTRAQI